MSLSRILTISIIPFWCPFSCQYLLVFPLCLIWLGILFSLLPLHLKSFDSIFKVYIGNIFNLYYYARMTEYLVGTSSYLYEFNHGGSQTNCHKVFKVVYVQSSEFLICFLNSKKIKVAHFFFSKYFKLFWNNF